jgi:superfamily II DNA or RNA helicase
MEMITVDLTEEEKEEYEKNQKVISDYLARIKLTIRGPADFQKLVMRSGRDPGARRALLARNRARDISNNSISKIGKLSEILKKHNNGKIFISTEHNKLVHIISRSTLNASFTSLVPMY